MVTRHWLLLASTLTIFSGLASCDKGKKTVTVERFLPTGSITTLDLSVEYPPNGNVTTCAGAQSYVVSIDTNGTGVWRYSLLFDATRTALYGCPDAQTMCPAGTTLTSEIGSIERVMIEGLSVLPSAYSTSSGAIDVICRGVADASIVPASIELTVSTATPEPTNTPTYATTRTFAVQVQLLRIGAGNELPFGGGAAPPQTRFGAAASYSDPQHDIGIGALGPRGRIALAGGVTSTGALPGEIWEFDPATLSFTMTPATLTSGGTGLAGLSATAFAHGAGETPAILFAGGSAGATPQGRVAMTLQYGGGLARLLTTAGGGGRSFHGAAYLERGASDPAIALIGGVDFDTSTQTVGTTARASYEYFVPPTSVLAGNCPAAATTEGAFCTPTANILAVARGYFANIPISEGGAPKVWIGGGTATNLALSSAETFDGGGDGSFTIDELIGASAAGGAGAVLESSGQAGLDGLAIMVGGFTSPNGMQARSAAYYRLAGGGGTGTSPLPNLKHARGGLRATTLRDRTILLSGGRNDVAAPADLTNGIPTVEFLVPVTGAGLAEFRFGPRPGDATCAPAGSTGQGCATLLAPRWGHSATRLNQTQTWLDGAVLIAGGGGTADSSTELFIPAYACDGSNLPVSPSTGEPAELLSNAAFPALCDLGRIAQPITNPLSP